MLHRGFVEYATAGGPLVTELRRWYDHSLLSAESFFHVLAANGPFCDKVVSANYRLANWKRKRGCKCQVRGGETAR